MRPRHYSYTPEAAGTATIAALQTLAAAGNLSLSGTYGANGFSSGLMWKLTLTSANNLSARTFTINYIDAQGNAQTSTTAGPNATTLTTSIYAQKVTSISVDGAAAAVSVGHVNVGYAPWKHLASRLGYTPSSVMIAKSGTATVALECTMANIADNNLFTTGFDYYTQTATSTPTGSGTMQVYALSSREIGARVRIDAYASGTINVDISVSAKG